MHIFVLICLIASANNSFGQALSSIKRASLSPQRNASGINTSYDPAIDGSGRYVAFTSYSDNFAAPGNVDGKFHEHGYVRDMLNGVTTQLDITSTGRSGSPADSSTPNFRSFTSSIAPVISRDGNYVAFISPTNNISPEGTPGDIGNFLYLKNIVSGEIHRLPSAYANDPSKSEYPYDIAINADGSVVLASNIIGNLDDATCSTCVWELTLYDRNSNTSIVINTGVAGNKFSPGLSDDGRFLVFENKIGQGKNLPYAYLFDRETNELTALNDGKTAFAPAISGDGLFIAYTDSDSVPERIKLRNRLTGEESPVSVGRNGTEPNGISDFSAISQDGHYIAFLSDASNLVSDDQNKLDDIFVFDRVNGTTTLVSVQAACPGIASKEDFNTGPPAISSDGKTITFAVLERLISSPIKEDGKVVEPADLNTVDDVYVATVDYDAAPAVFRPGFTPDAPFVSVNCRGSAARIQLQDLLSVEETNAINANRKKRPKTGKGTIDTLVQRVYIKTAPDTGRPQLVKKYLAKRNVLATNDLPPGNYSATVQAEAKLSTGRTSESKFSVPSNFSITK
jgi:Tol biopolymer transport system component